MANFSSLLFDTTRGDNPVSSNLEGDTQPEKQGKVADFLTVQSITWTGSITAIGLLWAFVQQQTGTAAWTKTAIVPLVIAAIIMAAAYLGSWPSLTSRSARLAAFLVAVINTGLLVAQFFVASGIVTK